MTNEEALAAVLKVVRVVLDDEDIDFTADALIRDIPEWDSLNNMHIVVRLEKMLGLDFQQSDFEGMTSIQELIDLIVRTKNGA
ncbi:MAG TPA: phosphopantetheine-binding protein [Fibrobacteria bacterium]|nr:phosphopantetheine-binding protein [Fibrobacteria bacterium]